MARRGLAHTRLHKDPGKAVPQLPVRCRRGRRRLNRNHRSRGLRMPTCQAPRGDSMAQPRREPHTGLTAQGQGLESVQAVASAAGTSWAQ